MEYIIPIDFGAFKPDQFHSQWVGTEENGVDSCFLVCTRVPPGTGTPGVHTHLGDQIYFILEGEMNLQLADQVHKAKAGDLVFIPAAVPHKNFNSSDKDEIHFEFIVPGHTPGLARMYRAEWPEYELKETSHPRYVRSLDTSKFDPTQTSSVTMADYSTGSHHTKIDIVQVPPGKGGGGLHVHSFDQVYYTMTGTMEVQIGAKKSTVVPNSYVYLPAGTPHTFTNPGKEVATHIHAQVPEGPRAEPNVPVNLNP